MRPKKNRNLCECNWKVLHLRFLHFLKEPINGIILIERSNYHEGRGAVKYGGKAVKVKAIIRLLKCEQISAVPSLYDLMITAHFKCALKNFAGILLA